MDAVSQYYIPELHPLAVHFPLSLLLTAAFTAMVWMWSGTPFWRHVTWLMLLLGTLGGVAAYLTGEALQEQSAGVPIVDELVGLHEALAVSTLATSLAATLALGAQAWWVRRRRYDTDPLLHRVAIGLLILVSGALVAWTGHVGALMVWGVAR